MKYLASVVSLIFLAKTLIWSKINFPTLNLMNLAELVENEPMKSIYQEIYQNSFFCLIPPNICLDEDVLKTSWRRLSSSSSEDVFKTSCQDVFKTFSRRLQDVFKTSSRHLQDVLPRRLQNVFKMSSGPIAKISSRCFQDVSLS